MEDRIPKTCVAGCSRQSDHEVRHDSLCPHYQESFSQMYDNLKAQLAEKDNAYEGLKFIMENKLAEKDKRIGELNRRVMIEKKKREGAQSREARLCGDHAGKGYTGEGCVLCNFESRQPKAKHITALEASLKDAREALDKYGEHLQGCAKMYEGEESPCTCGLEAAMKGGKQ